MSERVHKALARLGYGSRREIEEWIRAGRVEINRKLAQTGATLAPGDVVSVDGRQAFTYESEPAACRILVYYKPEGEICTRADPEGRPTIFDRLPRINNARWVSVGRLDINTAGLILLVTNGELANRLMHPSLGVEREYVVRVLGEVDPAALSRLRSGVMLEDGEAAFDQIYEIGGSDGANHWFGVVLKEGRNREVRRLWESQGVKVSRLKRVRFGSITLPRRLRRGHYEEMEAAAVAELLRFAGMEAGAKAATESAREPQRRIGRTAYARKPAAKGVYRKSTGPASRKKSR
ncbi:MAG: pseudouridine synthase [Gammaproteobacteria bacterium]|nr:pseudouridine synthase [Gammaproteobacteria bacterium]